MKRSTLIIFSVLLGLSFLALGVRLVQMQVVEGHIYQEQAEGNRIRTLSVKAQRGIVYDRNLRQLISNEPSFSVAVTEADLPEDTEEQAAVFERLAALLNTSPVVTAVPDTFFADPIKAAAALDQMAAAFHVSVLDLRKILDEASKTSPEAPNLLRRDVDPQTAAYVTAHAADWPGVEVMNELQYTFITRRERPFSPVTVKRNIPFETMQRVEEEHLMLPGVSVVPEPVRQYSLGSYLSHILGYVGPIPPDQYEAALPPEGSGEQPVYDKDDKVGLLGIEASMEKVLRGQKGEKIIEVNANQREVREISNHAAVPGQNVVLTIDSALQISVTKLLQNGIAQAHRTASGRTGSTSGGGVAVVQKVNTGEILALVSLPSYDNNLFASGISQQEYDMLINDSNNPMFNRAVGGAYPPGSTFKMVTAAAGLQEGIVTPETTVLDAGHIDVPQTWDEKMRTKYYSWNKSGLGQMTLLTALQQSSDVYFFEVAGPRQQDERGQYLHFYLPGNAQPQYFQGLGIDNLNKYMRFFGLGSLTGIDLPGEVAGVVPNQAYKLSLDPNDYWSLGDTLFSAIGQGYDLVTPLQLNNVTAAVANGGTLYQPQLVYQILDSDGAPDPVQDFHPKVKQQVNVNPAYLALIRQGMRMAVADQHKGTAYKTELQGVQIAGKTGTAEIGDPIDAQGHRRAHAWFTAFAPYEHPEIAVTVLIEAGDESLEGSTFAVPVARGIFEAYFHLENEH